MSSSSTRVPAPRCLFTYRTPGPARSSSPAMPSGIPGGDHQPLRPLHQPHHRHVGGRRAEHPVHVRQRVLAGSRVEQVRPGDVAQPVAQRDQAAEGPDVGRGERHHRVVRAQRGRRQVEHQVVRPDRDDVSARSRQARGAVRPARKTRRGVLPRRPAPRAARRHGPATSAPRRRAAAASRPVSRRRTRAAPAPSRPCRAATRACGPAVRWARGRCRGGAPDSSASSGTAKMSKVSAADTG